MHISFWQFQRVLRSFTDFLIKSDILSILSVTITSSTFQNITYTLNESKWTVTATGLWQPMHIHQTSDGNRSWISTSIIGRPYRFNNRLIIGTRNFADLALLIQFWNKILLSLNHIIIRTSLSKVTHYFVDFYWIFFYMS